MKYPTLYTLFSLITCCFMHNAFAAPASFIENKGQVTDQHGKVRHDIDFKLAGSNMTMFIGNGQIHYQWYRPDEKAKSKNEIADAKVSRVNAYRMDVELSGANKNAEIVTEYLQPYFENYYLPQCADGVTAHCYKKITYKNIYPNIDWEIDALLPEGEAAIQGCKYNFIVHPGGDYRNIKLQYRGATSLALKDDILTAATPMGTITENAPYTYDAETKNKIASCFLLKNNVLSYNISLPAGKENANGFIIDPYLKWGTYFGGASATGFLPYTTNLAKDADDNLYTCGNTTSAGNIATTGAYQTSYGGSWDGYIAKFTHNGQLVWATYYGGSGADALLSLAVSGTDIYAAGQTESSGMATTGSHQPSQGGGTLDGLLVKFNTQGQRQWATYYGGSGDNDYISGVKCDANGNVFICGASNSTTGIATSSGFQSAWIGTQPSTEDIFAAKFNSTGARQWGTYYGTGEAFALNCDGAGNVYISGTTFTAALGTSGTYQPNLSGSNIENGIMVKFSSSGSRLWATYCGSGGTNVYTAPSSLVVDASGYVYLAGRCFYSTGLGTTGTYQPTLSASMTDGFLLKFNNTGNRVWGTYLGGLNINNGTAFTAIKDICLSPLTGNLYLTAYTETFNNLSTPAAHQTYSNGVTEALIAVFSTGGSLIHATYYGGTSSESPGGIVADNYGCVYICGYTQSTGAITTPGTYQPNFFPGATQQAFVSAFVPDTAVFIKQPFYDTLLCAGDSLHIPDSVYYGFRSGNTFTVQLSNASGSFAAPVVIGSSATTSSGIIHCRIPNGTLDGTGYRIRIAGSMPGFISRDNEINIHIKAVSVNFAATTNSPVCETDTLRLYGTTTNPSAISWHWSGPNSFSANSKDTIIANATGIHAGNYILTANTSNGCPASDTVAVTVRPMPATPVATGNTPICSGGTLNLTATGTTTGVSWAWIGPNSFSSALQNPTINNIPVAGGGDYVVTSTLNGCSKKDTVSIVVNLTPAKPNAGSNTPLCSGNTLNLTASSATSGVTWSWTGPAFSSSLQNPSIANVPISASGSYIVTAILGSCSSSDTETVTVNPGPVTNIYPSPNDTVCAGSNVTMVALAINAGTGVTYQWYRNGVAVAGATASAYTLSPNNGDAFYCAITPGPGIGCNGSINSITIPVTVLPNVTPSVSVTANPTGPVPPFQLVTFTATPVNGGSTPQYQWTRNGTNVTGAMASSWGATTLSDHDTICVWLTSSERCPSPKTVKSSNCVTVTILTGVDDINSPAGIQLYPNPNDGHFTLHATGIAAKELQLEILDAVGRTVHRKTIAIHNNILHEDIEAGELPNGIYLLKLQAGVSVQTYRFTIER